MFVQLCWWKCVKVVDFYQQWPVLHDGWSKGGRNVLVLEYVDVSWKSIEHEVLYSTMVALNWNELVSRYPCAQVKSGMLFSLETENIA